MKPLWPRYQIQPWMPILMGLWSLPIDLESLEIAQGSSSADGELFWEIQQQHETTDFIRDKG